MSYTQIQSILSQSSSIKLLRAKNAPLIIDFLSREFKESNQIAIPSYQLADALVDYLEFLECSGGRSDGSQEERQARARHYLESWCSDEQGYLRKYTDDKGVDVHELTPDTERTLHWLRDLEEKEFVGTESIFLDIFRKVKELVELSQDDPAVRLEALQKRKIEIEAQIRDIESSGVVTTFNDTQVKERFYEINRSAKQLLADFREVEQNFRDLVRKIYEKHTEKARRKGAILGYVLDESETLKHSDQGRSFYTFWQVLMDRSRHEELDRSVASVYELLEQRKIESSDDFLNSMTFYLHEAGKKVIDSNHLLVEKLNRILSGQSTLERTRAIELITEIKHLALKAMDQAPQGPHFIEIDAGPLIRLPLERPLGEEPQEAVFENHPAEIGSDDLENADFQRLLNQFEINKESLLNRIRLRLHGSPQVTLLDVLEEYPLQDGLAELLTYFSIASQSSKHLIDDGQYDKIPLQGEHRRVVRIPRIVFTK
ncbi:hypothetical protein CSB45_05925 [candidate division KSB3 bacterium]|uniref:DUF3375 domain-containing protein n=1 Tax=candidate division KSB3 bacterium TaxID=2044937 RepID=A0A2G6E7B2_9BACT|nr:MAG: hypothetical protein CSB45_05925 [candidate division KSB3 bacterium]PIE30188.1 MAG: hypothetical protein CSA57_04645 [candidate division KSB3 bacterium]